MKREEKHSSEKRLIDANALIKEANADGAYGYVDAKQIANAPTIDAVEAVRCKDCKYYCQDKINGVICRHPALDFDTECFDHWINTNPDDFCSYGELKEGAD